MGTRSLARFVVLTCSTLRLIACARIELEVKNRTSALTQTLITYVRHGQSAGNANGREHIRRLARGQLIKGLQAHRDGKLTQEGVEQVEKRVAFYTTEMVTNIVQTELVMVSPLRRAMATAVLLLAHCKYKDMRRTSRSLSMDALGNRSMQRGRMRVASLAKSRSRSDDNIGLARARVRNTANCQRLDASFRWPPFQVVAELREKRKSTSEDPGSAAEDPLAYVEKTIKMISERLFCSANSMNSVMTSIRQTYNSEKSRTNAWETHLNNVSVPDSGKLMYKMISAFKAEVLQKRKEQNIVIVGHSGWGRYAFAPFLPSVLDHKGPMNKADLAAHLAKGAVNILPLNNMGTLTLNFEQKSGNFMEHKRLLPDRHGIAPGDASLPNFGKSQLAPCLFADEGITAGVLPPGSKFSDSFAVENARTSPCKSVRVAASESDGKYLQCFDKWLLPVGHANLNDVRTVRRTSQQIILSVRTNLFPKKMIEESIQVIVGVGFARIFDSFKRA